MKIMKKVLSVTPMQLILSISYIGETDRTAVTRWCIYIARNTLKGAVHKLFFLTSLSKQWMDQGRLINPDHQWQSHETHIFIWIFTNDFLNIFVIWPIKIFYLFSLGQNHKKSIFLYTILTCSSGLNLIKIGLAISEVSKREVFDQYYLHQYY